MTDVPLPTEDWYEFEAYRADLANRAVFMKLRCPTCGALPCHPSCHLGCHLIKCPKLLFYIVGGGRVAGWQRVWGSYVCAQ